MFCRQWFLILFALLGLSAPADAKAADQQEQLKEQRVKAGLFYNAIKYSRWPAEAFTRPDEPMQICLFGGDPFNGVMDLQNRSVQKRPINIKSIYQPDSAAQCHVVFINRSEEVHLDVLRDRHTLTVSDIDHFNEKGGMVEFSSAGEQIRIYLNGENMQKSGLRAEEELLRIAEAQ